jgi:hypothetical protein
VTRLEQWPGNSPETPDDGWPGSARFPAWRASRPAFWRDWLRVGAEPRGEGARPQGEAPMPGLRKKGAGRGLNTWRGQGR